MPYFVWKNKPSPAVSFLPGLYLLKSSLIIGLLYY